MIEIRFSTKEAREVFAKHYSGNSFDYHPNYKGQLKFDYVVGSNSDWIVYLDRSKIVDFIQFGQDVQMFGGRITG